MTKKKRRISGVGMGEANLLSTAYLIKEEKSYDIDSCAISTRIDKYIGEADGKLSISGLCIELGITRQMLELWRLGYVQSEDEADIGVLPNEALAHCVAMGELAIHQYWEECDKPGVQTKHVKMLENAGVIGNAKNAKMKATPPFDLGSLGKYSK